MTENTEICVQCFAEDGIVVKGDSCHRTYKDKKQKGDKGYLDHTGSVSVVYRLSLAKQRYNVFERD